MRGQAWKRITIALLLDQKRNLIPMSLIDLVFDGNALCVVVDFTAGGAFTTRERC